MSFAAFCRCETDFQRQMGEKTIEALSNRLLELDALIETRDETPRSAYISSFHDDEPPQTDPPQTDPPRTDSQLGGPHTDPPATDGPQNQDDIDTHKFVDSMRNKNTVRKTKGDMKKFEEFLASQNEMRAVHEIDAKQLDSYLARFFLCVKKSNGEEYEPDSLKAFQSSINRHISEKGIKINLLEDNDFKHSRDVLMSKRKLLKQQCKGNKENKAEVLSKEEINVLYEKNLLGTGTWASVFFYLGFDLVKTQAELYSQSKGNRACQIFVKLHLFSALNQYSVIMSVLRATNLNLDVNYLAYFNYITQTCP